MSRSEPDLDLFGLALPPAAQAVFDTLLGSDIGDEVAVWRQSSIDSGHTISGGDQRRKAVSVIQARLGAEAEAAIARGDAPLGFAEDKAVMQALLDEMFGAGLLERLLADDSIENVDANGCDVVWVTYADGRKVRGPALWPSDEAMISHLQHLAARTGTAERTFNSANPQLNIQLPSSRSRLFAVMGVTPRPSIAVRRHRLRDVDLGHLAAKGLFDA